MTIHVRRYLPLLLVFLLLVSGAAMLYAGVYGWTLFVVLPVFIGGVSVLLRRPANAPRAFNTGAATAALAACSLLLLGAEGAICIVMALPLVVPLGGLGGLLVHYARASATAPRDLTITLLLPLATLAWDSNARPPVYAVRTEITIHASREQVWKHVTAFSELPEPHEAIFRAGVAYPKRARIVGSGPGAIRYCEFSTGPFVEPIEVWDAPRLLRFRVTENPAPLQEWSPYRHIQPKHLHGYLVSRQGEFRLTKLPNGNTLLQGTTWYQHGLWPAQYWRWWSDAIIHRIHLRVLNHIKVLAEQENDGAAPMRAGPARPATVLSR